MDVLFHAWPYGGLVLATVLLVPLLRAPRPRDPAWVLKLLWPMYLLHQFEEHGIDLYGHHYAFLGGLCTTLGFPDVKSCPADPGFIFAVNALGCWIAFALPLVYAHSRPLIAACAWGIPIVNAFTHIGSAVAHRAYNPGVLTSAVLFIPLSLWMVRTLLLAGVVKRADLLRIIATGVLTHAVLLGSLLLRMRALPYSLFFGINVMNGLWPLLIGGTGRGTKSDRDAAAASGG